MAYKLCPGCKQPMLKKGQTRKHPDAYQHAQGCPCNMTAREALSRAAKNDDCPVWDKDGGSHWIEWELAGPQLCCGSCDRPFAANLEPYSTEPPAIQ